MLKRKVGREMEKESLYLKILRKIGLTTTRHASELVIYCKDKYKKQIDEEQGKVNQKIYRSEQNYKKAITELNTKHLNTIKKYEEQIEQLKEEKRKAICELEEMHDKYDGKYIVEKLPPVKLKTKQVMRVSNRNGVRSRIARNTVKDLEKE